MHRLNEILTPQPLVDDVDALIQLDIQTADPEALKRKVYEVVVKYLAAYLGIDLIRDGVSDLQRMINEVIRIKSETDEVLRADHTLGAMAIMGWWYPGRDTATLLDLVSVERDNLSKNGVDLDYFDPRLITDINYATTDIFAIHCLADVRTTAAMFQEVAFTATPLGDERKAVCFDVGSGTGILTLAQCVSTVRAGAVKASFLPIEIQEFAIQNSSSLLETLFADIHLRHRRAINLYEARFDVTAVHDTASQLAPFFIKEGPPNNVVIEMISPLPPRVYTDDKGLLHIDPEGNGVHVKAYSRDRLSDPFLEGYNMLHIAAPSLGQDVAEGRTVIFPDFVNGRYCPNRRETTLQLVTSDKPQVRRPLSLVGEDFKDFEAIDRSFNRFPNSK